MKRIVFNSVINKCLFLITFAAVLSGCAAEFNSSKISDVKITDFSTLHSPGNGFEAVFVVSVYEIPLRKFALIRIFAAAGEQRLPEEGFSDEHKRSGLCRSLHSLEQYPEFEDSLDRCEAEHKRTFSMLLYDELADYFWLDTAEKDMLIYRDWKNMPKSVNISTGRLGFSLTVFDKSPPALLVSPVFQESSVIPKQYLKAAGKPSETGRTVLKSLSVSTSIQRGDFLLLCPDMIPLDEMSFGKYAFETKDDKFKIYRIFCKSITGSKDG